MARTSLYLSFALILLFATAVFSIRAQPYDHHELRELLFPENCSLPCFMGIQPGKTVLKDALSRLRNSAWIAKVGVSESLATVAWHWNETHTDLMDNEQLPGMFYDRNAVQRIRLYARVSLGDLLLELGDTSGRWRVAIARSAPVDRYHATLFYAVNNYVISATVDCHNFWDQPASLVLGTAPQSVDGLGRLTYGLNRARRLIAVSCRRLKEL